jgi:hypothetical protein
MITTSSSLEKAKEKVRQNQMQELEEQKRARFEELKKIGQEKLYSNSVVTWALYETSLWYHSWMERSWLADRLGSCY